MLKRPTPSLARAHVVINAKSGTREGASLTEPLTRRIVDAGGTVTTHVAKRGRDVAHLAQRALDADASTVIAVGGDGTMTAVAEVLAGQAVTMGIIPQGTFNYFARGLGVPQETEAAMTCLVEGVVTATDVGRVNGRVFLNNTSIGLYASILKQREVTYRRFGRSRVAAYWSVFRALARFYDPMRMRIEVDGTPLTLRSPLAFVGASSYQLEAFSLDGGQAVRDGDLALFLANDTGRVGMVRNAAQLAARQMQAGRDFQLVTGREIVVDPGRRKRAVVRDGEKGAIRGPYRITREAGALNVIVPELQ